MLSGKGKGLAAIILAEKKPHDEEKEGSDEGLEAASEELLAAIKEESAGKVAEALKSAFEILDAMPHEEGEHENE